MIGFEGTAPSDRRPGARRRRPQQRGLERRQLQSNPAYGYDRSADGVYVDGGRDVLVEGNVVHDVNIGIEMASEHAGRSTRNITTRNNVVYGATAIGIAIKAATTASGAAPRTARSSTTRSSTRRRA